MQTFMPYADFTATAKVLDNQRLNKQALEGWQIMMTNLCLDPAGNYREPKGWRNHPAAVMWRGHNFALLTYVQAMVDEWIARGYKSTIGDKALATYERALDLGLSGELDRPDWFDSPMLDDLMSSHRKALLVKNYEWYSQFGWAEDQGVVPTSYEYIWANDFGKDI